MPAGKLGLPFSASCSPRLRVGDLRLEPIPPHSKQWVLDHWVWRSEEEVRPTRVRAILLCFLDYHRAAAYCAETAPRVARAHGSIKCGPLD